MSDEGNMGLVQVIYSNVMYGDHRMVAGVLRLTE